MAVWLVRVLDETDPARTADSGFVDVDAAEWWAPHVRRLAELGVTKGCATEPARYCPDESVTRAQMASFLTRAFDLAPGPSTGFQDVSPSSTHADAINALAAAGITKGCTAEPARYCPQRPVTRAQMATFLYRAVAREPRIAFVSDMDQDAEIIAADTTGTGTRLLTHNFDEDLDPAWSPDGSRVACVTDRDGSFDIFVMRADGSDPQQITDDDYREASPRWSPDGTRIAYTRDTQPDQPRVDEFEILVVNADGSSAIKVADDGHDPVWSPDSSRIAYDWNSGIFVVGADGANKRLLARGRDPSWSHQGERIAYTTSQRPAQSSGPAPSAGSYTLSISHVSSSPQVDSVAPPSFEIHVINADGTGHAQISDSRDDKFNPVWSPDGASILYTGHSSLGSRPIYVMDADGANPRQVTGDGLHPAWSPDGSFVVYSDSAEIFTANSDGTGSRQITDTLGDTSSWDPVLSPDGTRIAFRRGFVYGSIYVIATDGSEPVPVIRDTDRWDLPVWSPDSTRLAYSTATRYSEGIESNHIAVVDADGDGAANLTSDHETLGEGRAVCPAWSPDGTHIAFAGRPGGESGDLEIWVMDADGASITQLTDNLDSEGCPLWSPDGTRLLYTIYRDLGDLFPASEIWVMHADGTGQRMLAETGESPSWSPDSTRIAYVSDRDGDREIFVMQADGTNQTQLTFNNDEDLAPVWSPLPKG